MFDITTPDAKTVRAGTCINKDKATGQRCGLKMSKYMPHEPGDSVEPICERCNVYYTFIGNTVMSTEGAMKEFNRRWREYMEGVEAEAGI